MPGLFAVLYGINNLGKTTQAKKLVERLQAEGHDAVYLKYPVYNIHPSGTLLNEYLRGGNPYGLSPREAQSLYILNRTQYQKELEEMLARGTHVIAEDYTGTGIAWGVGAGVQKGFLDTANSHLRKEDLAFHFDGERFMESKEDGHKHEEDTQLMKDVRDTHNLLKIEHGWIPIDANKSIDEIHDDLWKHVAEYLG